jgi:hypothetical protein
VTKGQQLAEAQAAVREQAHHCLVLAAGVGEMMHLSPAEHPRPLRRLPYSRIALPDRHPSEGIQLGRFVGDRILSHGRERPQDVLSARGRAALVAEHHVNELVSVSAPQVGEGPIFQANAL